MLARFLQAGTILESREAIANQASLARNRRRLNYGLPLAGWPAGPQRSLSGLQNTARPKFSRGLRVGASRAVQTTNIAERFNTLALAALLTVILTQAPNIHFRHVQGARCRRRCGCHGSECSLLHQRFLAASAAQRLRNFLGCRV